MPINYPSLSTLTDRNRASIRNQLVDSDPTIFGSFVRALADSTAGRSNDLVFLVRQAVNQCFPQTAEDVFLELWAEYDDIFKNAATPAKGFAVFTGTASTLIPINTVLKSANGDTYATQEGKSIINKVANISSLTRSGTTATAVAVGHNLATGLQPTIAGVNEAEYNGTFSITVTDPDTFTYEITGSPTSPATGTITFSIATAVIQVLSQSNGQRLNLAGGAVLTFSTPINNVDGNGYVQFEGLVGGTDVESSNSLRSRTLESRANPVANFNEAAIIKRAKTVSGVTDVFVKLITPNVGDVTVYFLRRDDVNPIPTASEIQDVKDILISGNFIPATSDPTNVYVLAPTIVSTDFTFAAISPDTPTMRTAITNSLIAFFEDKVVFEKNITQDAYRCAISETQDPETGDFLLSFALSTPSGDITINAGEIGWLGVVSFS